MAKVYCHVTASVAYCQGNPENQKCIQFDFIHRNKHHGGMQHSLCQKIFSCDIC